MRVVPSPDCPSLYSNLFINRLCLLFTALLIIGSVSAQNEVRGDEQINYADSALYYFNQSRTVQGIDTMTFMRGMGMLWQMTYDPVSFEKLDRFSDELMVTHPSAFSDALAAALISNITRSDSLDRAIAYCTDILQRYDAVKDPALRQTAMVALMEIRLPLRNKDLAGSLDYYASRIQKYLGDKDSSAINISYFCLGAAYRLAGLPDMAIYNYKKALSYINKNDTLTTEPVGGLGGWTNHVSVLGQMSLEVGDFASAMRYSFAAREVKLHELGETNVSFLNGNIAIAGLMLNDLDSVYDLLSTSIPMAIRSGDYPSLVRLYEVKGRYFLALNMPDSAEASLLSCKEAMVKYHVSHFSPAGSHTPNYYLAKLRIQQGRYADARNLLEQEIAEIQSIKKELLKEQKLLLEVLLVLGDSNAADSTFRQYSELQTFLAAEERKYRNISFEVESRIEDAENTINDLVTEKRIADVTRKYLIGIAVLLLIVASIIFNRFRVTRKQKGIIEKEKRRSDELLLNILPAEVAEELKDKGSAEARHFDLVTVLFTDFKGFTQFSEKLAPAALVAEINTCFSAFDHIMEKYGIEKIKTIGDAYMAAGGLSDSSKTPAEDVIRACLEIQQFMAEYRQKKEAAGDMFFEIRIGVHTGPVVAGIVGVKKFAYDIWGDTVNTASRMESSGEVGKINISGATYELIRDTFICTHRGNIQAKGKGEIAMYFVEGQA